MISWNCKDEKVILDFPYVQVVERLCINASKGEDSEGHRFYVFKSRDWCNIIPVTEDGKIVLIKQFRAGVLGTSIEFPGGVVESEDANIQATALREMVEETGYQPLPNAKCVLLGTSYPNPALQDNRAHSLIVGPVKKTRHQALDPMEDIEVVEVAIADLLKMIAEGQLTHALMLTTLFHFLMQNEETKTKLISALSQFSH
jgi:ADP-ribose pyrophosphatase